MKKAVVYGRVSKDDDTQDYGRQLYELQVYAGRNSIKIVKEFTERVSGAKLQRQQLDLMLEFVRKNDIREILVTELSRFGRLGYKTRDQIEELAKQGINMYFKDKGLNTLKNGKRDDTNMMVIGILCDIAEQELITLKNRIVSGLVYSAKNNGSMSGKYQAYGFKGDNKKLVQDKEEVKVVQEIFRLYKSGLGCSQIANHLNNKRVKTRYNKIVGENLVNNKKGTAYSWSTGTIVNMLKNKLYKGERWHNDALVANFEPVIDPLVFDQIQLMMKKKNNRPIRTIKNDNYLKNIIKCSCGQPYYMHKRKDGHDNAYKCLSLKLQYDGKMDYCGSPSINIDKLLESLYSVAASTIITKLKSTKSTFAATIETNINIKKIELSNTKQEIKEFERKLTNLYEDYNDRSIEKPTYLESKAKYASVISKAQDKLEVLTNDLKQLEQQKDKPVRDYYSKQTFLREIRSVLSMVTVSSITPNSKNRIADVFGTNEKNVPVLISLDCVNGDKIQYVLARFSKKMISLENGKYKVAHTLRKDSYKFPFMFEMTHKIDELLKKQNAA